MCGCELGVRKPEVGSFVWVTVEEGQIENTQLENLGRQGARLREVWSRDVDVVEKSDSYWEGREISVIRITWITDARRIPSWSEDLTFATITSEANGRNTTMRNTTAEMTINNFRLWNLQDRHAPLYHKKPSPYRTLPSPDWLRSNTQMQRPTSWRTRLAYFLFSSAIKPCSTGAPKFEGWMGTVSLFQSDTANFEKPQAHFENW